MRQFIGSSLWLFFLALLSACGTQSYSPPILFVGETQGTYYRVSYFSEDTLVSQQQIENLLADFDTSVSVYNPTSLITQLNRGSGAFRVDDYFLECLSIAQEVSQCTEGAFDCTVGPLVEAWGFSFKEKEPMNHQKVDSLKRLVDYRAIEMDEKMITLGIPGMRLDFNAVAQGVSVEVVARLLLEQGITRFLVDIGGEVKASGRKPDGSKWRIAIEKPSDNAVYGQGLEAIVQIHDKALATSGSYRKFYVKDGVKYSHTINPLTGYPVTHSLLSATVIADDCGYADAWATAIMVLGPDRAKKMVQETPGVEAFLIFSDKNGVSKTWFSEGFRELLE